VSRARCLRRLRSPAVARDGTCPSGGSERARRGRARPRTGAPRRERAGRWKLPGKAPLSGGTLDLAIGGLDPTRLDAFELQIGLSGPIDAPRIHFDDSTLTEALKKAGKAELGVDVPLDTGGVQKEIAKAAGEKTKGLLDGVLGGGKKP
jgi:hypothetical protein